MSEVEIISLLPGTRLERDLYSVDGHLLLGRDTVLNEKHLDRLLQLGYTHLYTSDMQESVKPDIERQIHSAPNSRLPQVFGQAVDNVRHLMSKVASGHMVPREDIEETIDLLFPQVIQTGNVFARLQELRQQDEYTMQHSVSVGVIAIKIGQTLGLSQNILRNLGIAGLMHDIGKARIAQDILNKPGPLDAGEFREMQKHPVYGYQIVRDLSLDDPNIGAAVLQHHEHQNGTGYPQQLKANQI
ncbi:MAG TPA: HD domain-containing phosphohydrolase, partial [Syntrophomonadaceae bacterium]|nr:HD domain-containing phosphohydrolase [Syntrophomonadaceae bacterium]